MKINLHCHTNYSDGGDIFEMANQHKRQGFSAFVATDHVYPLHNQPERSIGSYETFQRQARRLKQISKQLAFPCIQGMELALWGEEVLVFGAQTYPRIFQYMKTIDYTEHNNLSPEDFAKKYVPPLIQILKETKDTSAIILCHPRLCDEWVLKLLYPVLDGYEFQNGGQYFFTDQTNIGARCCRTVPLGLAGKNKFYNSDAHSVRTVACVGRGNFHDSKISTLNDLIKYIKTPQQQK